MLKCPQCQSDGNFVSNQYIEHHDAVFDGNGTWIRDFECYDSHHDTDGATCECWACGYKGTWAEFEAAAER